MQLCLEVLDGLVIARCSRVLDRPELDIESRAVFQGTVPHLGTRFKNLAKSKGVTA